MSVAVALLPLRNDDWSVSIGSLAEWATVLVAFLALLAAVASAIYSRNQARSARRTFEADAKVRAEAQARKVYSVAVGKLLRRAGSRLRYKHSIVAAPDVLGRDGRLKVDALLFRFAIYNNSDEVIGPVAFWAEDHNADEDLFEGPPFRTDPTTLLPRERKEVAAVVPLPDGWRKAGWRPEEHLLGLQPSIEFADSVGQPWRRVAAGPIERLSHPPGDDPP
ncbi:hypothetical protein [Microbacterium yannicii]|uniref:hypothetical protein n=1 Tax=Microbacterium yannicii TaxID=671622 RepID=UPI0012F8D0EF|nr:hypothetical protein [Microbacterium yannicii]